MFVVPVHALCAVSVGIPMVFVGIILCGPLQVALYHAVPSDLLCFDLFVF